jgi:hypothetical protein
MTGEYIDMDIDIFEGYFEKVSVTPLDKSHLITIMKTELESGLYKMELVYEISEDIEHDDYYVKFDLGFVPGFFWAPHLTPEEGYVIDKHVFRTPALIARGEGKTVTLIPDLRGVSSLPANCYMDMDAPGRALYIGMSETEVTGHILYKKTGGAKHPRGPLKFAFCLMLEDGEKENPFRDVLRFIWKKFGARDFESILGKGDLTPYVKRTYNWAFGSWKDVVWQEFELSGKKVGAAVFIVTASQSPNFKGIKNQREARSVWNQAWFCSLRSASGLLRYAKRTNNRDLMEKANLTKELALSFPQEDGLFCSVIACEMESFMEHGKQYMRAQSWDSAYFGNSDRNPFGLGLKEAPRHILDMSFTAYYMLIWYDELEDDARLEQYCRTYAERLVCLQDGEGFFPGWVDDAGRPMGVLDKSPESAMSAAFLIKYSRISGEPRYLEAALSTIEALKPIIEAGGWEDFETYWSCSRFWSENVGKKIERNDMYKQCNFSMYFTVLALWEAYEATGEEKYLMLGRRVLDEMLMMQASWQPDWMPIPVVGGFGVLNCDAEWNDARQSLFAELIVRYGRALGENEYIERGLAAIRAAFQMMYCPENPQVKEQWEIVWPHFNEKDYGFNMENYGHNGKTDANGLGIGEFTIYDWGNGAASEGFLRMLDRLGPELVIDGKY